jgi:hypothetical protein
MTGSFGEKRKLGTLKSGNPDFYFPPAPRVEIYYVVHFPQFLLLRRRAAESRPRSQIIRISINLVEIAISSLQASLFPPVLAIFEEKQRDQPKWLSMNYLRKNGSSFNQAQSRLIKANQAIFLESGCRRSNRPILYQSSRDSYFAVENQPQFQHV